MTNNPAVSVIIPARNEAAHVANTISSVESLAQQVIVVDDGSWDNTADIARGLGAEVIRRNADPGKGQSLACGLARARGDIIVFLDADLGSSGGEVKKLIAMITAGKADLVVARIEQVGTPGWGVISKTSQRLLTHLGVTVTQPLCGQRGGLPASTASTTAAASASSSSTVAGSMSIRNSFTEPVGLYSYKTTAEVRPSARQ